MQYPENEDQQNDSSPTGSNNSGGERVTLANPGGKSRGLLAVRIVISAVLVVVALIIGMGIFSTLAALKKKPEKVADVKIGPLVRTLEIARGDHPEIVTGFGPVVAPVRATVAARVGGTILSIDKAMQEGLTVQPGTVLITIDPEPYATALAQAQAQQADAQARLDGLATTQTNIMASLVLAKERVKIAEEQEEAAKELVKIADSAVGVAMRGVETAKSNLELGRARLARLEELFSKNDVSKDSVDAQKVVVGNLESALVASESQLMAARNGRQSAQAGVLQATSVVNAAKSSELGLSNELKSLPDARKQLEAAKALALAAAQSAELSHKHTRVEAPFADAKVRKLLVRAGDTVPAGAMLFIVAGGERVEVEVRLPASKRADIAVGTQAIVRAAPGGASLAKATISRISPSIDEASRTFTAYIVAGAGEHLDPKRPLVPGELVFVEVTGKLHRDVLTVPRFAEVDGSFFVAREGRAVRIMPDPASIVRAGEYLLIANGGRGAASDVNHGIKAGDLLVISNLDLMADGAPLRVAPAGKGEDGAVTPNGSRTLGSDGKPVSGGGGQ